MRIWCERANIYKAIEPWHTIYSLPTTFCVGFDWFCILFNRKSPYFKQNNLYSRKFYMIFFQIICWNNNTFSYESQISKTLSKFCKTFWLLVISMVRTTQCQKVKEIGTKTWTRISSTIKPCILLREPIFVLGHSQYKGHYDLTQQYKYTRNPVIFFLGDNGIGFW